MCVRFEDGDRDPLSMSNSVASIGGWPDTPPLDARHTQPPPAPPGPGPPLPPSRIDIDGNSPGSRVHRRDAQLQPDSSISEALHRRWTVDSEVPESLSHSHHSQSVHNAANNTSGNTDTDRFVEAFLHKAEGGGSPPPPPHGPAASAADKYEPLEITGASLEAVGAKRSQKEKESGGEGGGGGGGAGGGDELRPQRRFSFLKKGARMKRTVIPPPEPKRQPTGRLSLTNSSTIRTAKTSITHTSLSACAFVPSLPVCLSAGPARMKLLPPSSHQSVPAQPTRAKAAPPAAESFASRIAAASASATEDTTITETAARATYSSLHMPPKTTTTTTNASNEFGDDVPWDTSPLRGPMPEPTHPMAAPPQMDLDSAPVSELIQQRFFKQTATGEKEKERERGREAASGAGGGGAGEKGASSGVVSVSDDPRLKEYFEKVQEMLPL